MGPIEQPLADAPIPANAPSPVMAQLLDDVLDFTKEDMEVDSLDGEAVPALEGPVSVVPPLAPPAPPAPPPIPNLYVRVGYIGQPSQCDEWISLQAGRLAELNSASTGRRGDLKVRDEILLLSRGYAPDREPMGGIFASAHENAFVSIGFVALVNHFGQNKGFQRIVDMLQELAHTRINDYVVRALPMINLVCQVRRVLAKPFLLRYSQDFFNRSRKILLGMNSTDLRNTSCEAVDYTLSLLELFILDSVGCSPQTGDLVESIRLNLAIRYFSSPYLNRRLGGLKMICDLLKRTTNAVQYPDGIWRGTGDLPLMMVMARTYSLSTSKVCTELLNADVFRQLYEDSSIHESLVARSTPILQALAEENQLDETLLGILLKSSLVKGSSVPKILAEVVTSLGAQKMRAVLLFIEPIDSSAANEGLINILHAIALYTRRQLMNSHSEARLIEDEVIKSATVTLFHDVHALTLKILWTWASEGSGTEEAVKVTVIDKLEGLVELGITSLAALEDNCFPWAMQWYRVQDLLHNAVDALAGHHSVDVAVKVLQTFLFSWPSKKPSVLGDAPEAPFPPMRFAAADYIANKFDIFAVITDCIGHLRQTKPRPAFLKLLELLLEFLHNLFRNAEKTVLPIEALYKVWRLLILQAEGEDEFDFAVLLMNKIPTRASDHTDVLEIPGHREAFHGAKERWLEVYSELICDGLGGFIQSDFFNVRSLKLVEKWFRWVNAELNLLVDRSDATILYILDDLTVLQGVDVFKQIVFTCKADLVAGSCVQFIMSLIQVAGNKYATKFREDLLSCCLQHMTQRDDAVQLQRILLLLDGLVNESYSAGKNKIYAHNTVSLGKKVVFKVSSSSKKLKEYSGEIVMRCSDSVEELVNEVAKLVRTPLQELKIFRLGKEVSTNDYRRAIAHMHMICDNNALVVAERPHIKPTLPAAPVLTIPNTSSPSAMSVDSNEPSAERNVALSLVCSESKCEALFHLLHTSSSTDVLSVWNTISQLPTFHHLLSKWTKLSCNVIADLCFPLLLENGHRLGELVYFLQIIVMLLEQHVPLHMLFKQYGTDEPIEDIASADWLQAFLTKQGFHFLCSAYEWVYAVIQRSHNDHTLLGINGELALQSVGLLNKVLRICLIAANTSDAQYATFIEDFVRKDSRVKEVKQEGKEIKDKIAEIIDLTGADSPVPALIPATSATLPSEPPSPKDIAVDARLTVNFVLPDDRWVDLFWLSMLSTLLIQHLVLHEPKADDNELTKNKKESKIKAYHSALDDSLFLFSSISILHPAVLNDYRYVRNVGSCAISGSYEALISQGLLSSSADNLVSFWLASAIIKFLDWALYYAIVNSDKDEREATDLAVRLRAHVFGLFLAQRPSISLSSTFSEKPHESLFVLATKMLHPHASHTNTSTEDVRSAMAGFEVVSADKRREICKSIVTELQAVHKELQDANVKAEPVHLEGNCLLLAALTKTTDKYVLNYFDRNIVEFLLNDVLGIVETDKCLKPIVAKDKAARSHVYEVLSHICQQNTALSLRTYNALKAIHNTIPRMQAFEVNFEAESKHRLGYGGLRNLGSTCYMNSLLQMLFMIPGIRSFLLSHNLFDHGEGLYSATELQGNVIYQLQKVFKHLFFSDKKFHTPLDFMYIFNNEYNVQQDACEYFLLICEKFENCLAEYNSRAAHWAEKSGEKQETVEDIFKLSFGGQLCNQMFVAPAHISEHNANNLSDADMLAIQESIAVNGIREQVEHFNVISLDVKNCHTMADSLAKFVKNEVISDYSWKDEAPKVNIIKRQCIASVSQTLIFHLKRFELNFDTFIREKVNDSFDFPLVLDTFPFTKEGLSYQGGGAHDSTDYLYELCGVIVHTGTSDSGHYFAYLKDSEEDQWVELNDAEIYSFKVSQVAAECFGGVTQSHEYNVSTESVVTNTIVNPKNAYMLVYQKQKKVMRSFPSLQMDGDPIYKSIVEDNAKHRLCLRILNKNHFVFYIDIVQTLIQQAQKAGKSVSNGVISESIHFLLRYVAHTPCRTEMRNLFDLLYNYIVQHDRKFVASLSDEIAMRSAASSPMPSSPVPAAPSPVPPVAADDVADLPPAPPVEPVSIAAVPDSAIPEPVPILLPPVPPSPATEKAMADISSPPRPSLRPSASMSVVAPLSTQCLEFVNANFQDIAMACLIQAPSEDLRMQVGQCMKDLVKVAWEAELHLIGNAETFLDNLLTYPNTTDIKMGALSFTQATVAMETENMDADLAMALKLSKEEESKETVSTTAVVVPGPQENILLMNGYLQTSSSHVLRFLFELTMDNRLGAISECWRKHTAYIHLLRDLAEIDRFVRVLFIQRDLIAQTVDMILGDGSPLNNKLYAANSGKKRAPSSYVTAIASNKMVFKNIPDWSQMLALLVELVKECHVEREGDDGLNEGKIFMSEWDLLCITSKAFYATLIKQGRYVPHMIALVECLAPNNSKFTVMLCEVICEEMTLAPPENLHFVFDLLYAFLQIPDRLAQNRIHTLFGKGSNSLLELFREFATSGTKTYSVLTFIRSFITLFSQCRALENMLCVPHSAIAEWAGWMVKFIDQHVVPCLSSATAAASSYATVVSALAGKGTGPTVVVFGEEDSERQLTWSQRFDKTQQLLSSLLLTWDIDAAVLVSEASVPVVNGPLQKYATAPPAPVYAQAIPFNGKISTNHGNNVHFATATATVIGVDNHKSIGTASNVMELSDGMTDEELARFLESGDFN